ncbi:hypothetical protein [Trinickia diaoshuihuensis]|jgi:hypothetical protein|uniref:hypothetical protein n=1 Tax=Trinickia diaoshuihuensis TaxID=2292265 RepID=UPI0013C35BED|nr:hypothetical protein [Trinickia diaoshuihuensis]
MNAPSSERLVVFVTPAQKRVLAARAQRMGISLSELVRRAVLAFDETGQEVRAAGLVDRLGAASVSRRDDALRRLAQGQRAPQTPREAKAASPMAEASAAETTCLPVAAAVAQALAAQAVAPPAEDTASETQTLVARVLANKAYAGAIEEERPGHAQPAIESGRRA